MWSFFGTDEQTSPRGLLTLNLEKELMLIKQKMQWKGVKLMEMSFIVPSLLQDEEVLKEADMHP